MQVQSLGPEDLLEEGMATHFSNLGWRIPWTEEPGGLQSKGAQSLTRLKRLGRALWRPPPIAPFLLNLSCVLL